MVWFQKYSRFFFIFSIKQASTQKVKCPNTSIRWGLITFLRWPSLSLKISSCSWYSACDNLRDTRPTSVQLPLRAKKKEKNSVKSLMCGKIKASSYASLSVPLALLLRLFCSRLGGGVWAIEGGLRLASSFLCRSMSSRWELILSCCLGRTGEMLQ